MSNKTTYIVWGVLYLICAGLGFVQPGSQQISTLMTLISIGFFIPGFLLLYRGERKLIRCLSAASLGLTLVCILLNILATTADKLLGDFLYVLLGLLSAPMYCSRFWLLSLFLWACLLMGSIFMPKAVEETK